MESAEHWRSGAGDGLSSPPRRGAAKLTISLFSGKRFGENIETVARITISEGQTVEVPELKKFGYEPVSVKLLSRTTVLADVPLVTNPAAQLRTTVNNVVATLPTFNIKFLNDSPKDIMAFEWHTETDGHRLVSGLAQGLYGKALMDAGGTYEMNIKASKRETDLNPLVMVIGSVIYRDGAIDGDPNLAASFIAFTEGRKKALEQIVPLLQRAAELDTGRTDLSSLISKVNSLSDGNPRNSGRASTASGVAFDGTVTEAVGFLRRAQTDFAEKSDAELGAAVSELANFYIEWQARMKR